MLQVRGQGRVEADDSVYNTRWKLPDEGMEWAVIAVKLTCKAGSGKRRTKTHTKPKEEHQRDGTESRTALQGLGHGRGQRMGASWWTR